MMNVKNTKFKHHYSLSPVLQKECISDSKSTLVNFEILIFKYYFCQNNHTMKY